MTLNYIMELGQQLPDFPEVSRSDDNIVRGCQSKVWLTASNESGNIEFKGDSNTAITKGLISLLLRVLSGQKIEDIAHANLYFVGKIILAITISNLVCKFGPLKSATT